MCCCRQDLKNAASNFTQQQEVIHNVLCIFSHMTKHKYIQTLSIQHSSRLLQTEMITSLGPFPLFNQNDEGKFTDLKFLH